MPNTCSRHVGIPLLALGMFFTVAVRAHVPACGATIGTPGSDTPFVFTLSDDMGPCPGDGLILASRYITVNMNGRTIRAMAGNTGAGIRSEYPINTVVLGKGRIEGFGYGISLGSPGSNSAIVQDLAFVNNNVGVYIRFGGANGAIDVRQNTITGGGTGIRVAESRNVKLKDNTINGQTVAGIALVAVEKTTVINNNVLNNYEGLTADSIHLGLSSLRIVLNQLNNNSTNGMRITGNYVSPNNEYLANTAAGNLRDGFVLPVRGGRTEDNIASANHRYGFLVEGENHKMIENKGIGNIAFDLFFNPSGALGNCFSYNQFWNTNTSSLPACP